MKPMFLITYEGAPACLCASSGEADERIAAFEPADADLIQVWDVGLAGHGPAREITHAFVSKLEALRLRDPAYLPSPLRRAS